MTLHGQLNTARCQQPDTSLLSTIELHQNVATHTHRKCLQQQPSSFKKWTTSKSIKAFLKKKWTNHCCVDSLGVKCSLSQAPRPLLNIKKKQLKQILTRPPTFIQFWRPTQSGAPPWGRIFGHQDSDLEPQRQGGHSTSRPLSPSWFTGAQSHEGKYTYTHINK